MLGQLTGVSRAQNLITTDFGINNLALNIAVGEADNKSVLVGLVLVLILGNKLVSLAIISATL